MAAGVNNEASQQPSIRGVMYRVAISNKRIVGGVM